MCSDTQDLLAAADKAICTSGNSQSQLPASAVLCVSQYAFCACPLLCQRAWWHIAALHRSIGVQNDCSIQQRARNCGPGSPACMQQRKPGFSEQNAAACDESVNKPRKITKAGGLVCAEARQLQSNLNWDNQCHTMVMHYDIISSVPMQGVREASVYLSIQSVESSVESTAQRGITVKSTAHSAAPTTLGGAQCNHQLWQGIMVSHCL